MPMKVRRGIVGLALAAALSHSIEVRAEETRFGELAKLVRELLKSAEASDIAKVVESFTSDIKDDLASSPVDAYHICDAVADYARPMTRHSAEDAGKVIAWTVDLADRAVKATPDDVSARWAKACALIARARSDSEAGKNPTADDWVTAADLFVEGAKTSGGSGRAQSFAVESLVEAASLPGGDAQSLLAKAAEIAAQGGTEALGAISRSRVAFARARVAAPGGTTKSKPHVDAALTEIGTLLAGEKPDLEAATLHTSVVTFARATKVPGKYEYRTVEKTAGPLRFSVPLSKRWETARRGADLGSWNQYDDVGNLVRAIDVWEYDWTINYVDEDTRVGGDNVKGLVKRDQQRVRENFSSIKAEKPLTKAPLNRTFPTAYSYEFAGTYENGDFARVRTYYFKSKERMKTYNVELYEYTDMPKLDPEIQFVLDSIGETKETKK
jgi:hypothetical protein